MTLSRSEISLDDKWNLDSLFSSPSDFEKAFSALKSQNAKPFWKEFYSLKGHLKDDLKSFIQAFELYFKISREIEKLYTYTHLKHDEDITDAKNKEAYEKMLIVLQEFQEESSWFEPEIFTLSDTLLKSYLENESFKPYRFYLEKLLRLKEHILSEREEEILALAERALQTPSKAFSSINNADFKFPNIQDANGKELALTHGLYQAYMQSRDRTLRERAFKAFHAKYSEYENTLCDLIHGEILSHQFNAKTRKYVSSLEAAIKVNNIPTHVYHSLIKAVHEEIGALHDYLALRKKILRVDELHLYDLYVPLTKELDIHIDYKDTEKLVIESVAPLGKSYQDILAKGLLENRWVDRYENKNKRSGAYSSGCFDSEPYILMNFKGIVRDLFTLSHECGHSMHSYLSRKNQPYHYSDYSIFVAEVASTFNEELLSRLLLERTSSKEEKIFYINSKIEDIRTTLFRQTLFAEFELLIHDFVEKNIPLTPTLLKEEYRKLNAFYFGPSVHLDEEICIEWARIPHFYYNFYVYQYATGISAALALAERVLKGSDKEREEYLTFLKGGSSNYPIELLRLAGVDMESTDPVKAAIHRFKNLVNELSNLC